MLQLQIRTLFVVVFVFLFRWLSFTIEHWKKNDLQFIVFLCKLCSFFFILFWKLLEIIKQAKNHKKRINRQRLRDIMSNITNRSAFSHRLRTSSWVWSFDTNLLSYSVPQSDWINKIKKTQKLLNTFRCFSAVEVCCFRGNWFLIWRVYASYNNDNR